jgi:hypothetical protein
MEINEIKSDERCKRLLWQPIEYQPPYVDGKRVEVVEQRRIINLAKAGKQGCCSVIAQCMGIAYLYNDAGGRISV